MAGTGPLLSTGATPPPTMVASGVRPVPQRPDTSASPVLSSTHETTRRMDAAQGRGPSS